MIGTSSGSTSVVDGSGLRSFLSPVVIVLLLLAASGARTHEVVKGDLDGSRIEAASNLAITTASIRRHGEPDSELRLQAFVAPPPDTDQPRQRAISIIAIAREPAFSRVSPLFTRSSRGPPVG